MSFTLYDWEKPSKFNFTKEEVNFIRTSNLKHEELAEKFNCSVSYIRAIQRNVIAKYYDENYKPKVKQRVFNSKYQPRIKKKPVDVEPLNNIIKVWS